MNNIQAVRMCLNQDTGHMCPAGFQNSLRAVTPVGHLQYLPSFQNGALRTFILHLSHQCILDTLGADDLSH